MDKKLFVPFTKADEATRIVEGWASVEEPDADNEIMDVTESRPHIEAWSKAAQDRTGGLSKGNVREQHRSDIAAGLVHHIEFAKNDAGVMGVHIRTECVDDSTWRKIQKGVLTGFSFAGKYGRKWRDEVKKALRYAAIPREVSYVDAPCVGGATFTFVKADGSSEQVAATGPREPEQFWACFKACAVGEHLSKSEAGDCIEAFFQKASEPEDIPQPLSKSLYSVASLAQSLSSLRWLTVSNAETQAQIDAPVKWLHQTLVRMAKDELANYREMKRREGSAVAEDDDFYHAVAASTLKKAEELAELNKANQTKEKAMEVPKDQETTPTTPAETPDFGKQVQELTKTVTAGLEDLKKSQVEAAKNQDERIEGLEKLVTVMGQAMAKFMGLDGPDNKGVAKTVTVPKEGDAEEVLAKAEGAKEESLEDLFKKAVSTPTKVGFHALQ